MLARLTLLFVVVPIIELTLLTMLADAAGWKVSVGLVLLTGATGAWLVRHQGWKALRKVQTELRAGQLPGDAIVDGALVVVAGLLLLTPGLLTDLVGIGLLIPFTRALVKRRVLEWVGKHVSFRSVVASAAGAAVGATYRDADDSRTIDAQAINVASQRTEGPP